MGYTIGTGQYHVTVCYTVCDELELQHTVTHSVVTLSSDSWCDRVCHREWQGT